MRRALSTARAFYGANPLHLLALLGCFALAGYAVTFVLHNPSLPGILIWFAAAVIGHDLVLFPLYALADRSITTLLRPHRRADRPAVPALNYLRIPFLGSALLLVLFLPGIIEQGAPTYHAATGLTQQPFLGRWLLITGVLFLASALTYTARLVQARHRPTVIPPPSTAPVPAPRPARPIDDRPARIGLLAAVVLLALSVVIGILRRNDKP